jgi:hypothetical protein
LRNGKNGENEKNVVEEWCFSNVKNGKNEENVAEEWCFSNGKNGKMRKNVAEWIEERGSNASQNEAWICL